MTTQLTTPALPQSQDRTCLIRSLAKILVSRSLAMSLMTCAALFASAATARASTFIVNTTADDDNGAGDCSALDPHCTLRKAIRLANDNLTPGDTIDFNIPIGDSGYNGSWWTITLNNGVAMSPIGVALPMLVDTGTTINGFSQPGSSGTITSGRPGVVDSDNTCPVLTFQQPRIAIDANKAVLFAPGAYPGEGGDAMSIDGSASFITIQGMAIYNAAQVPDTANGNAVAAYSGPGTNRVVDSMFIGVLPDGTDPGVMQRNDGFGVQQRGNPGGSLTVSGSYVGYNGLTGINGEANFSVMTILENESFMNSLLSDSQDGIDVNGINGLVRCNLSHENMALVTNGGGGAGLEIGSTRGDANLDNNVVEYNSFYENQSSGISIRKGARGNLVQKNVVHDNTVGISVNIEGRVPTNRNQIWKNSTYQNMTLGIDLEAFTTFADPADPLSDITPWLMMPDGITPNDDAACDADGAPGVDGDPDNTASNDLQNFPELTSADLIGTQIRVTGALFSTASRTYVIQFFATPAAETSGLDREGKYFIGQIVVTLTGCSAAFDETFTPEQAVAGGDQITATATRLFQDPADVVDWWSTSEYSAGVFANLILPEGKVTGGGYITPAALTACSGPCIDASDKRANFGFVAQYKNQTDFDPQGHINFVWRPGNLHFGSTDYVYASLFVTRDPATGNGNAKWQGEGKLNNKPGYCFKANVTDLGEPGTPDRDRFRIKIWENVDTAPDAEHCTTESTAIYDNGTDTVETLLSGGNIQIHHP